MSHQVLAPCFRTLGKRSIVQRASLGSLPSPARAVSTSRPDDPPTASTSSSKPSPVRLLTKKSGFFNPSHPPSPRPSKWPTTPESAELRVLLLRPDSPHNAIYDSYLRLVTNPLHAALPQAMHQLVLRRIVPPASTIRLPSFSQRADSAVLKQENRLREVVFHMRAAGVEPTLGDYHFVLEQMAALGHQRAAYNVYVETVKSGHKPTERTIALALLALVRRHKMRIYDDHAGTVLAESHGIADRVLGDLLELQNDKTAKPVSPMCFDLACRVFKITGSLDKFLSMLKNGYGVDISQPDYRPLEFVERMQAIQARIASTGADSSSHPMSGVPRFSTHTLNTTLDILGRSRRVREMVSAFEVLTNPLPANARADSYQYDTWEDDEPETASTTTANSQSRLSNYVPSAAPNTASLAFIIKHTVNSYKFDLCKHYLLLAIHLDRESDTHLRQQLRTALRARRAYAAAAELEARSNLPAPYSLPASYTDPRVDIPRVAVSHEMFTKVWGLANQKAHMRTLRGLVRTVRRLIRRKRKDIAVYNAVLSAVPMLGAPMPVRPVQADSDLEEQGPNGEIPSWLREIIEERPPPRRQFSLATHVALLEAETEKLDQFLVYGIRGVEHSSLRVKDELQRKRVRKVERVAKVAEEAEAKIRKKEKWKEEREKAEEGVDGTGGMLAPA